MTDHDDNVILDKTVRDGNNQERKLKACLGQTSPRFYYCVFIPTFCDFVDHLWLLLEKLSFKKL